LPGDAGVVQHCPDRVRTDLRQTSGACRRVRCKEFNDQVAVPSRSRSGGRRNSARIRSRSSGPYCVGGRSPACRSTAARPTRLKRVTHAATESPRRARRVGQLRYTSCLRSPRAERVLAPLTMWCTVTARQLLQGTPLGVRERSEWILLGSAHNCPPGAVPRNCPGGLPDSASLGRARCQVTH
jgi:hypothetical protein